VAQRTSIRLLAMAFAFIPERFSENPQLSGGNHRFAISRLNG
jgi:hypothetical protein